MKRLFLGTLTVCLAIAAAAFSNNGKLTVFDLTVAQEERNPWTHLRVNNDPADFQFAIVSDRTGGHRPGVFSRAVDQLNLLQPEFVVSVGDLIEGYSKDQAKLTSEWKEFQTYAGKLQMPFFYVPGNHDLTNELQEQMWKDKFGRKHYHLVYRDVLFLMLNSTDPAGKEGVGEQQLAYIRKALDENPNPRWTFVFLHHPLWNSAALEKNGWLDVEKALLGRQYTVFAGHIHRYHKFVRQGQNYYQLATTGGGSKMRGLRYGEFDQIAWITMKKGGPIMANVLLDGVFGEDMKPISSDEPGVNVTGRRATYPVRGQVLHEGSPTAQAQVTFHLFDAATKKYTRTGDAFVDGDGAFVLSSYTPNDGAPVGEYAVTVVWRQPWLDATGKPGPNMLAERYSKPETSDLRVKVVNDKPNDFVLELKK